MGATDRFFAPGTALPTMPEVARRLIDSFEKEKVDLRQIVELAERDQSLSVKILKQANSAHYGVSGNVTNLRQASVLLGLETLRNLVLSACMIGAFPRTPGFDRLKFWRHCVATGGYSRWLGRKLGFAKVSQYAHQFGIGELAGYNIEGEHLGEFPSAAPASKLGGVGKMCSYGESISMTPLQLGSLMGAIANGGTLYFLQHPQTLDEVTGFTPLVKRQLSIAEFIPQISDGMRGAVSYGTARRLNYNFSEEQVLGKTGTCSKAGTRFGWFASYANTDHGSIVVVVFLRGGRPTFGPKAAEIAGRVYRNLYDHSFFAAKLPVANAQ